MMFVSDLIRFRKQPFADAIFYKNIDVIKILEIHGAKHPVRIWLVMLVLVFDWKLICFSHDC
jgi:hypothetical protein